MQTGAGLRRAAAAVALLQGMALLVNAMAVTWVVVRDGITGPSAIASPVGVTVEVALYLVFGAAMMWIARGMLRGSEGVQTPFVLAQVLGLTVAIPLATGGGAASLVGWALTFICILGVVVWGALLRRRGV